MIRFDQGVNLKNCPTSEGEIGMFYLPLKESPGTVSDYISFKTTVEFMFYFSGCGYQPDPYG